MGQPPQEILNASASATTTLIEEGVDGVAFGDSHHPMAMAMGMAMGTLVAGSFRREIPRRRQLAAKPDSGHNSRPMPRPSTTRMPDTAHPGRET